VDEFDVVPDELGVFVNEILVEGLVDGFRHWAFKLFFEDT